jgi:hypothetical protein
VTTLERRGSEGTAGRASLGEKEGWRRRWRGIYDASHTAELAFLLGVPVCGSQLGFFEIPRLEWETPLMCLTRSRGMGLLGHLEIRVPGGILAIAP